ncbi:hypothetical protein ACFLYH_03670, partial [Candidatus Dependentiae bacterium]
MKQETTLIPAQLFIGNPEILTEETEKFLQKNFCQKNFCSDKEKAKDCYCNNCRQIKNHQHEFIVFIEPEKDYKIKDIDVIFEKINFALDQNQKFFFILQKANTLNLACANKLLKALEEPPSGYNFILHTNNLNSILPTIRSRCHIINFQNSNQPENFTHPLLSFFYNQNLQNPTEFEKELRHQALTDSQSVELAQNMMNFYAN